MAYTITQRRKTNDSTDGTSSSPGSDVTPSANSLYVLEATVAKTDGAAEVPTVSGTGWASGTWTPVTDVAWDSTNKRSAIWTTVIGASPSAGRVTLTTSATHHSWLQRGFDISDPSFTPSVIQSDVGSGASGTSLTLDTGLTGIVGATIVYAIKASNAVVTGGTGFTDFGEEGSVPDVTMKSEVAHDITLPGNDPNATSNNATEPWAVIGLEIGQAGSTAQADGVGTATVTLDKMGLVSGSAQADGVGTATVTIAKIGGTIAPLAFYHIHHNLNG
jgi:hypothetical protein